MTTLEVLKIGRARIARGWCRFSLAENSQGHSCDPEGLQAVAWCALGGLMHDSHWGFSTAFDSLAAMLGSSHLADWNNQPHRTQADVLALYDKAIAAEEAKAHV